MTDILTQQASEYATGRNEMASPFTDKRGYGARWQFSPRKIDGLIAAGMPHLKIGARRIRICVNEADAWMQETFRVQRRAVKGGAA